MNKLSVHRIFLGSLVAAALLLGMTGCIGTVISTVGDVVVETVKVPFKVGGAIVDAVTGDDEDEEKE